MASFKDRLGRTWSISLVISDIARLRQAGLDLGVAFREPDKFTEILFLDPEVLGRVMWTLCEPQTKEQGIDEIGFTNGFDGPTISAAIDALLEAITDFRHRPEVAAGMKTRLATAVKMTEQAILNLIDAEMADANSTSKSSAGNSPESPVSNPDLALSAK